MEDIKNLGWKGRFVMWFIIIFILLIVLCVWIYGMNKEGLTP